MREAREPLLRVGLRQFLHSSANRTRRTCFDLPRQLSASHVPSSAPTPKRCTRRLGPCIVCGGSPPTMRESNSQRPLTQHRYGFPLHRCARRDQTTVASLASPVACLSLETRCEPMSPEGPTAWAFFAAGIVCGRDLNIGAFHKCRFRGLSFLLRTNYGEQAHLELLFSPRSLHRREGFGGQAAYYGQVCCLGANGLASHQLGQYTACKTHTWGYFDLLLLHDLAMKPSEHWVLGGDEHLIHKRLKRRDSRSRVAHLLKTRIVIELRPRTNTIR